LAIEASVVSNFLINDSWTINDVETLSAFPIRLLNMNAAYGAGIGIACATLLNFAMAKNFVWRSCP
jgi:putative flippase GtrA